MTAENSSKPVQSPEVNVPYHPLPEIVYAAGVCPTVSPDAANNDDKRKRTKKVFFTPEMMIQALETRL